MTDLLRVGVIGAAGQIGSALMRYLASQSGLHPIGLCRNEVTATLLRLEGLDVRVGSASDPGFADALLGDCDVVVNCSADMDWPGSARARSRALMRAIAALQRPVALVVFSSVAVYGTCISRTRSSFRHPRPQSLYAREKLALERYASQCTDRSRGLFILRVGHVYGPDQWLSRAILDIVGEVDGRLPFDGQRPSNAVHIDNVCRAVAAVIQSPRDRVTLNLVDRPQRTWRDLIDWHADAVGARRPASLDTTQSLRLASDCLRDEATPTLFQFGRELVRWAGSLPFSLATSSPAARLIAGRALARISSERLERRLKARYAQARAASVDPGLTWTAPPWLLSEEAPGPVVNYKPHGASSPGQADLAAWFRSYSDAETLFGPLA